MMDFGCGSKPYKSLFNVNEYVGVDYHGQGHSHVNEQIDVFYDGVLLPFPDNYFDSVFSTEVFEHVFNLENLNPETRSEMMELASRCTAILRNVYRTESFNMGINIGEAAGAGVLGHVHIHIVPRWAGDTNFMSSTGGTRVLPEALEDTYKRVKEAFEL